MPLSRVFAAAFAGVLLLSGCSPESDSGSGGGGGSISSPTPLEPADTEDFTHAVGVITAKVALGAQPARMIVDSGAPLVTYVPSVFPAVGSVDEDDVVVNGANHFE